MSAPLLCQEQLLLCANGTLLPGDIARAEIVPTELPVSDAIHAGRRHT
jgi:hypothetical protein